MTIFNKPEQKVPPAKPQTPPPWPPELVAELKDVEGAVQDLIEKDRELRQRLPRLAREAKDKLTTPGTNILREFQELDIDRAFEAKRVAWTNKMVESQAAVAGKLVAVRRKYGPEDKRLADECARILARFQEMSRPWPPLK